MENISSQVNQVNVSIAALTDRIRKSLNGVDRAYFDIQERMSAIRQLSKVEGQTELNKLSDFLNKKIDDIAGDIKEASISSLRANKERLENLHGIAKDTLDGSQQGKGVYDQYQILVKKLDEEIQTRKKIVFRMEDFLKKNGIDTISVISALTTRNPMVGLAIKYVLERRKAAKEKEANEKSLDTKDSIAYRELLMKQRENLVKPVDDETEETPKRKRRKKKAIAKNTVEVESEETEPAKKGRRRKPAHHAKKPSMPHIIDADFETVYAYTDQTPPQPETKKEQKAGPINYTPQMNGVVGAPKLLNAGAYPMPGAEAKAPVAPRLLSPGNYAMPEVKYQGPKALLPKPSGTRMHNKMDFNPSQLGFIHDLINEAGGNTVFGRKELQDKNKEKRGQAAAPDFIVKNLNAKTPEKGKYDLGNLLPQNQALVPSNKDDKFLHAMAALNLSTIHVYTDLEKYHKEDHLFDEKKAEDAEQDHLAKIAQDEKLLAALKELGSGEGSGLAGLVHQPKDKKGHPIVDHMIARGGERAIEKIAPRILKFLPGAGLIKRFMPTMGKAAPGAIAAGEGAAEMGAEGGAAVAEGTGAVAAKTGGSLIGRIAGPILGFGIDAVLGMFKSDDWKTSKTSASLGGALAGTFNNKIINVFSQMGKYAALGAAMGAPFAGFGAIPGGIIGAAVGAVMGVIGGENIANFAEKTGIGRYISSFFGMLGTLFMSPIKHVWDALKDVGSAIKFAWKAVSSIFTLVMKPLSDMFSKTIEPLMPMIDPIIKGIGDGVKMFLGFFSDIYDWISNFSKSNDEAMDKAKAQSGQVFENLLTGFQKTLLNMITGILESIPSWVPGAKTLKELAKGYRKESEDLDKKTASPVPVNPASAAPAVTTATPSAPASPSTPGTPSKTGYLPQSPKVNGDINSQPATTPTPPAQPAAPSAPQRQSLPVAPKPILTTSTPSGSGVAMSIAHSIAKHEGYGKPGAIPTVTNNPGDIIDGRFARAHGSVGVKQSRDGKYSFAVFPDAETGFKAEAALIDNYIQKGASLESLINHLNPPNAPGNTPEMTRKYLAAVARETNIDPKVPLKDLNKSMVAKNQPTTPAPAMVMGISQSKPASLGKPTAPLTTDSTPAALTVNKPSQGSNLLQMISQNEDAKADLESKSGSAPMILAPTQTNTSNTSMIATQPNPRNTDSTFRDARFRTAYSA
jgi:hypothetical protein